MEDKDIKKIENTDSTIEPNLGDEINLEIERGISYDKLYSLLRSTELKKLNEELIEVKSQLIKATKSSSLKIKKVEETVTKNITESKLTVIETLAIFVALFTFISIEFQIFRSFTSWQAGASLSFIILGALIFFVVTMDFLLHERKIELVNLITLIISVACLIAGVILFSQSQINNPEYISQEAKILNTKITALDNELNEKNASYDKTTQVLKCIQGYGYFTMQCFEEDVIK